MRTLALTVGMLGGLWAGGPGSSAPLAAQDVAQLPMPTPDDRVCRAPGPAGPSTVAALARLAASAAAMQAPFEAGVRTVDAELIVRELEADGVRVRREGEASLRSGVRRVTPDVDPDDLLAGGFLRLEGEDDFVFVAPTLELVADPRFAQTHCLRLGDPEGALIGLSFEPHGEQEVADVAGVVWMDRTSALPVALEFAFREPASAAGVPLGGSGGSARFAPLPDGSLLTYQGHLRVPLLEAEMAVGDSVPERWRLGGFREEVFRVTAVRDGDAAFALDVPRATVSGRVRVHADGDPLAGAVVRLVGTPRVAETAADGRFAIGGLLAGDYGIEASHPAFDRLPLPARGRVVVPEEGEASIELAAPTPVEAALELCGSAPTRPGQAAVILTGQVTDSITGEPLVGVPLELRFRDPRREGTPTRQAEVWSGNGGEFVLCDLPPGERVLLRALLPGAAAGAEREFSSGDGPSIRQDLKVSLSTAQSPGGVFGTVREYGTMRGIESALVTIRDSEARMLTNRNGFFAFPALPPGLYVVEVSALGYEPREVVLRFAGGLAFSLEIELTAEAIPIEGITVTAVPRRMFGDMVDLQHRMELGFGTFVMKAELDMRGGNLSQILRGRGGVRLVSSRERPGGLYVVLREGRDLPLGGAIPGTDQELADLGAATSLEYCYPAVWVDGRQWSTPKVGGLGHEPVDVTEFLSVDLEAIEIYKGAATVPGEFGGGDAACGALVLWTRRGGVTVKGEARSGVGSGSDASSMREPAR